MKFIEKIAERSDVKDMGKLHHFLGVKVIYLKSSKVWVGQPPYTKEVMQKLVDVVPDGLWN